MASVLPLVDVRVGSTILLPCRLTAKSPAGVTLEAVDEAFAATGAFSIAADLTVSGAWTTNPRDQPVRVVAFALEVGNVVRELATGVTAVVMATNVGGNPNHWSPAASGRPTRSTDGWEVIGNVALP